MKLKVDGEPVAVCSYARPEVNSEVPFSSQEASLDLPA